MTSILIAIYIVICIIVGIAAGAFFHIFEDYTMPASVGIGLLAALLVPPAFILCIAIAAIPEILICATIIFVFA